MSGGRGKPKKRHKCGQNTKDDRPKSAAHAQEWLDVTMSIGEMEFARVQAQYKDRGASRDVWLGYYLGNLLAFKMEESSTNVEWSTADARHSNAHEWNNYTAAGAGSLLHKVTTRVYGRRKVFSTEPGGKTIHWDLLVAEADLRDCADYSHDILRLASTDPRLIGTWIVELIVALFELFETCWSNEPMLILSDCTTVNLVWRPQQKTVLVIDSETNHAARTAPWKTYEYELTRFTQELLGTCLPEKHDSALKDAILGVTKGICAEAKKKQEPCGTQRAVFILEQSLELWKHGQDPVQHLPALLEGRAPTRPVDDSCDDDMWLESVAKVQGRSTSSHVDGGIGSGLPCDQPADQPPWSAEPDAVRVGAPKRGRPDMDTGCSSKPPCVSSPSPTQLTSSIPAHCVTHCVLCPTSVPPIPHRPLTAVSPRSYCIVP